MGEVESVGGRLRVRLADAEIETPKTQAAAWQSSPHAKEEEFTRAVALGLFDYLRKSRSQGFVVSLSGGADSSAVSCLVALMTEMAFEELGAEAFCRALSHIPGLAQASTRRDRVRRLLHCVYQATRNSSQATRSAATSLAEALGAEMSCLEIDDLVEGYVSRIEAALHRKLTWETDDVALQNIQARVRGPSVWLLANVKNALLLATSNRSEAAVGYATMDGDTCGGLSPIAGIDKAFLLQWLRWLETEGPSGLHPIPALAAVTHAPPTAELRPSEAHQTDEDDLMPYKVLDAIERAAIRDKQSPLEVFRLDAVAVSRLWRRANCTRGSIASFASGAATSGSANATPRRSTSTTRISIPRPGAGFRFSRADFGGNSKSCGNTWRQSRSRFASLLDFDPKRCSRKARSPHKRRASWT